MSKKSNKRNLSHRVYRRKTVPVIGISIIIVVMLIVLLGGLINYLSEQKKHEPTTYGADYFNELPLNVIASKAFSEDVLIKNSLYYIEPGLGYPFHIYFTSNGGYISYFSFKNIVPDAPNITFALAFNNNNDYVGYAYSPSKIAFKDDFLKQFSTDKTITPIEFLLRKYFYSDKNEYLVYKNFVMSVIAAAVKKYINISFLNYISPDILAFKFDYEYTINTATDHINLHNLNDVLLITVPDCSDCIDDLKDFMSVKPEKEIICIYNGSEPNKDLLEMQSVYNLKIISSKDVFRDIVQNFVLDKNIPGVLYFKYGKILFDGYLNRNLKLIIERIDKEVE